MADVAIECRTPDHRQALSVARVAILLYPVGVWLLILCLLLRIRGNVGPQQKQSRLSNALRSLYREYEPSFYWCVRHNAPTKRSTLITL